MNKSFLKELLIVILVGIIIFQRACPGGHKSPCPPADTVTTVSYVYDTLWHTPEKLIIRPPVVIVEKEVPADVDTAAILQRFFNSYHYTEVWEDSNQQITILDSVSQNQITWRDVKYLWNKPLTVITKNIITPPAEQRAKVFLGGKIGGTKQELTAITPEIMFLSKKDHAYSIGYNLSAKSVELGALWKISFRKP